MECCKGQENLCEHILEQINIICSVERKIESAIRHMCSLNLFFHEVHVTGYADPDRRSISPVVINESPQVPNTEAVWFSTDTENFFGMSSNEGKSSCINIPVLSRLKNFSVRVSELENRIFTAYEASKSLQLPFHHDRYQGSESMQCGCLEPEAEHTRTKSNIRKTHVPRHLPKQLSFKFDVCSSKKLCKYHCQHQAPLTSVLGSQWVENPDCNLAVLCAAKDSVTSLCVPGYKNRVKQSEDVMSEAFSIIPCRSLEYQNVLLKMNSIPDVEASAEANVISPQKLDAVFDIKLSRSSYDEKLLSDFHAFCFAMSLYSFMQLDSNFVSALRQYRPSHISLLSHESNIYLQQRPTQEIGIPSVRVNETFFENVILYLIKQKKQFEARQSNLTASVDFLHSTKKELEKKLAAAQKQCMETLSKENEFRKRANYIFLKERSEFHQYMSAMRKEQESLLEEMDDLKNRNHDLEVELDHVRNQFKLFKVAKEEEISSLQFKLNVESLKYERALKRYAEQENGLMDMKRKINNQEESICFLEGTIKEIKQERETELKRQWQELEEIQFSLITRDEECMALNDDLKKCVADLDDERQKNIVLLSEISDLKEAWKCSRTSMEAELSLLRSDCKELRKKLIKLTKEKDLLWKKTDHLTHLREAQVAGRWMDDHEVTFCLRCNARFSFTLRKHHCRLCGKIFCRYCANNWLFTAASRRQIRVCSACYTEHLQLKKAVKDGSSVNSVSDSDDEAGGSSLVSSKTDPGISSINSGTSVGFDSLDISMTNLSFGSQDSRTVSFSKYISSEKSKPLDANKNCNFDVITDEEIAKSLSHSSPYNALLDEREYQETNLDSGVSLTLTRTTNEIKAAGDTGISGEIWINAGMRCGIPILCDHAPSELFWKFFCNAKALSFTVVRKNDDSKESLFCCGFPKTEDSLVLPNTGLYIILFDNSFSRVKARKVQYTLWVH